MKKEIIMASAVAAASLYGPDVKGADPKRPNIILFMVDDMGWQDTSLPFWKQKTHYNELYETPNM